MAMKPIEIDVILPHLHRAQEDIANHPARFRVVACGRRFGKTHMAVLLALYEMLRGGAVMWIAPSYDKTMIGWRLFEELGRQIPLMVFRRSERRIVYPNGGWIAVYSADSEGGVRGEGASLVVVDEAAHIRELERLWEQELRPALTDRMGRALFISTPRGMNYFYKLFRMADYDTEWQSWQLPSSANPFLAQEEIESARRSLPALVFRQEYLAEFVQLAGTMFRREWFDIVDHNPPLVSVVRYWDLAATQKTTGDYSVGVKIGLDSNGTAYVIDMVRGRMEWPELIRVIAKTALADGPEVPQYIETAGVQKGLLDLLLAEPTLAGIPIRGVNPSGDKIMRANAWLARAEQGKVKLVRGTWTQAWLDEVSAFPEAEHDDIVDATSGAFAAIGQSKSLFVWYSDEDIEH
jgi:predicted phage terminase large subunit-like protein